MYFLYKRVGERIFFKLYREVNLDKIVLMNVFYIV